MKIAYLFMNYPAPSEVFGQVEIESLKANEIEIECFSVFNKFENEAICNYVKPSELLLSIFKCLISPIITLKYFLFCWKVSKTNVELLKNVSLYPRAICLAEKISKSGSEFIHCFWGHYPSTVLYFINKNKGKNIKSSLFTGAYDLESKTGIMEWGVNNSDLVFTHAHFNKQLIREFYNGNVNVVYRGVKSRRKKLIQKKISKTIVFCCVGRLDQSKRPDLVLKLFAFLKEHMDLTIKLDIFGSGPLKYELIKLSETLGIKGDIEFHGHQSQVVLFQKIQRSHFILFPSEQASERLPNSVKEAMNLGCIPIVSSTSGINELVENDINGYIVDFKDANSILSIINKCLRNNEYFNFLSSNAQNKIRKDFCVDKLSKTKVELYKKVLK